VTPAGRWTRGRRYGPRPPSRRRHPDGLGCAAAGARPRLRAGVPLAAPKDWIDAPSRPRPGTPPDAVPGAHPRWVRPVVPYDMPGVRYYPVRGAGTGSEPVGTSVMAALLLAAGQDLLAAGRSNCERWNSMPDGRRGGARACRRSATGGPPRRQPMVAALRSRSPRRSRRRFRGHGRSRPGPGPAAGSGSGRSARSGCPRPSPLGSSPGGRGGAGVGAGSERLATVTLTGGIAPRSGALLRLPSGARHRALSATEMVVATQRRNAPDRGGIPPVRVTGPAAPTRHPTPAPPAPESFRAGDGRGQPTAQSDRIRCLRRPRPGRDGRGRGSGVATAVATGNERLSDHPVPSRRAASCAPAAGPTVAAATAGHRIPPLAVRPARAQQVLPRAAEARPCRGADRSLPVPAPRTG